MIQIQQFHDVFMEIGRNKHLFCLILSSGSLLRRWILHVLLNTCGWCWKFKNLFPFPGICMWKWKLFSNVLLIKFEVQIWPWNCSGIWSHITSWIMYCFGHKVMAFAEFVPYYNWCALQVLQE